MPAMLDDPLSPTIHRTSGSAPYPDPHNVQLPSGVHPRQVTLRDRVTTATIIPFTSQHQVPPSLLAYLSDQLSKEIENGDTYPMMDTMSADKFASYWFQNFGAIMLTGAYQSPNEVVEGKNWAVECLGSFYIKPNYPGRSSHVCNAGFLVTDAARNRGVGRLMGESYIDWAPKFGYSYSVFNLVYETNVASCRIWDALGFKRIGRVKGAGNLKSYPGQLIDVCYQVRRRRDYCMLTLNQAIIYGRDLGPEGEDFVSEERFDKIKFYLKFGKYPAGADRAEKSRLRSAATHYKINTVTDALYHKEKEVISDPQKQYEIAQHTHALQHGGINKTTAIIAEKYHWVRIKETVGFVIKNCSQCKELGKAPTMRGDSVMRSVTRSQQSDSQAGQESASAAGQSRSLHQNHSPQDAFSQPGQGSVSPQVLNRILPGEKISARHFQSHIQHQPQDHQNPPAAVTRIRDAYIRDAYLPLDPRIMEDVHRHLDGYVSHSYTSPVSPSEHRDSHSFQSLHSHRHGSDEDLDMLNHDEYQDEDGEEDEGNGNNDSPMREADGDDTKYLDQG